MRPPIRSIASRRLSDPTPAELNVPGNSPGPRSSRPKVRRCSPSRPKTRISRDCESPTYYLVAGPSNGSCDRPNSFRAIRRRDREGLRADRCLEGQPAHFRRRCLNCTTLTTPPTVSIVVARCRPQARGSLEQPAMTGVSERRRRTFDALVPGKSHIMNPPQPPASRHSVSNLASVARSRPVRSRNSPAASRLLCQSSVSSAITASGRKVSPAAIPRLLSIRP